MLLGYIDSYFSTSCRMLPVKIGKQITEQLSQFIFINITAVILQCNNTLQLNITTLNSTM